MEGMPTAEPIPPVPPEPRADMDAVRLSRVLAGLRFPAHTWQLIAQADYYGADWRTRAELSQLPDAEYPNLAAVLAAVARQRPRSTPGAPDRGGSWPRER
jgi:hypothetical protein